MHTMIVKKEFKLIIMHCHIMQIAVHIPRRNRGRYTHNLYYMRIHQKINKEYLSDSFALSMTKFFRFIADTFFAKRYGHRAVVLETVAGVPGMVAGVWMHFKSLRKMKTGYGAQIRDRC